MITKAELEKMVEDESVNIFKSVVNPFKRLDMETSFESGASFVTGILMPEIERVENNCDTLENKAIFWMETNDRAIEHTESLQLTITTLKTEIQSLKDENGRMREALKLFVDNTWNEKYPCPDEVWHKGREALTQKAEE